MKMPGLNTGMNFCCSTSRVQAVDSVAEAAVLRGSWSFHADPQGRVAAGNLRRAAAEGHYGSSRDILCMAARATELL